MSLVPCHRGSVNAWECDENDHLNVRFYLAKTNQGLPFALEAIGLSPAELRRRAARPVIKSQHVRFLREARPATPLTVFAGLAAADGGEVIVYAETRHSLTGETLATVTSEVGFAGADGTPLAISAPAAAQRCQLPEHGAPRGLGGDAAALRPSYGKLEAMGFVEIGRGTISAQECDAFGEMEPYQYVGRMSDSVVNLLAHVQTPEELSRRAHGVEGGALVELKIRFHAALRAGSLFSIRSGIAEVGRKTQHFVHLFFNEESRTCVATAEGIAVAMDLKTRRSIELPEARRRRIEARLLRLP